MPNQHSRPLLVVCLVFGVTVFSLGIAGAQGVPDRSWAGVGPGKQQSGGKTYFSSLQLSGLFEKTGGSWQLKQLGRHGRSPSSHSLRTETVDHNPKIPAGTVVGHILRIDLTKLRLEPIQIPREKTLKRIVEDENGKRTTRKIVAAVNGGFFHNSKSLARVGNPRPSDWEGPRIRELGAVFGATPANASRWKKLKNRHELVITDGPKGQKVDIKPLCQKNSIEFRPIRGIVLGGGGTLLPRPQSATLPAGERPDPDATSKRARTAVAFNSSNPTIVFLITVDEQYGLKNGKQIGTKGVTIDELSGILKYLGADKAIALDGGGSSTMVFYRTTTDKPDWSKLYVPSANDFKNNNFGRPVLSALLVTER